jgi:hypothetical protein
MDILDNVIGMMGDNMMQAPTRASIFANVLRGGQPSFSEQPMAPTPQPEAMQQPAPPPPIANPNNYRLPRAMAQYQPPQMAQPAPIQAAPQPMQPPQGMPQQQQGPMTLGQDYQTLIQRQQANDEAMQRALQPADRTEAEAAYRAHANSAMGPTMLALAAQQGGPSFQHMQDAWMRQAEEAQQPIKMAGGTMTSSGFIPDPEYTHALELKRLELKDASINKALEQNLTLSERARLEGLREQNAKDIADAQVRMHLQVAQMIHAMSGSKEPGTWTSVGTDPESGTQVFHNNKTNQLVTTDTSGQTVPYTKPLTARVTGNASGEERMAAGYLQRMQAATPLLDRFEVSGRASPMTQNLANIPLVGDYARTMASNPAQQQYYQAAMDWVRAKLRKESGAVIGEKEARDEFSLYFPMAGDSKAVIEQKRQSRASAEQAMRLAAGRAYEPLSPAPAAAPSAAGGGDDHPDGSTATGPGGARMIKRGGQWVPA